MGLNQLPWNYDLWRTTEPSYLENEDENDDWFAVYEDEEKEEEI